MNCNDHTFLKLARAEQLALTRRTFLQRSASGIGLAALGSLFGERLSAAPASAPSAAGGLPGFPNFAPKAKRIIYLFQSGAPSQMDLFDPKPELTKRRGEDLPDSIRKGQRLTTMTSGQKKFPVAPTIFKYAPHGQSEMVMSELLPHLGEVSDELCMVRSLYTIWKRTASPPTMTIFDSPTREICTVKRSRTNTPLQALSLLNEVTFVEAARAFAQRMILEGGATPEERIGWAFKKATGRTPKPAELQVLANGLNTRLERYQQDADNAKKLVTFGASKADAKANPTELAAYTLTANVLLNLDEVITRE